MLNAFRLALSMATAAFALSACATTRPQTPLPDGKNVAIGQQAYVDGPIIQPVAVLEDSRCPTTVRCVWAGQVWVKMLWIRSGDRQQAFEVTLGKRTQFADGSILLESVRPEKRANATIPSKDYRFAFRFDGGY